MTTQSWQHSGYALRTTFQICRGCGRRRESVNLFTVHLSTERGRISRRYVPHQDAIPPEANVALLTEHASYPICPSCVANAPVRATPPLDPVAWARTLDKKAKQLADEQRAAKAEGKSTTRAMSDDELDQLINS